MTNSTIDQNDAQFSRRSFLKLGLGALGALALLESGGASLLFLQPRRLTGEYGTIVNAGTVESFPTGTVTEFPDGRFFLVRSSDGGFLALSTRCTHLGCAVRWEAVDGQFFCPCHASAFDIHGDVKNAPAPRALDTFTVRVDGEQVIVDTSHRRSREAFALDQLTYA